MEELNVPNDDDSGYVLNDLDYVPQRLEEGIYMRDFTNKDGFEFSLKSSVLNEDEDDTSYFVDDQLLKYTRPECLGFDEDGADNSDDGDTGMTPFNILALKMEDVSPDGKLKKRVLEAGFGDTVVPEGALVFLQYSGYCEYIDDPFDSTFLRGKVCKVRLGEGSVIIGLEKAAMTMKKGERSQFLIHPDLAFGMQGCPPRIPPATTLMFEVTVEDFKDSLEADAIQNKIKEDGSNDFQYLINAARGFHVAGVDSFKRQAYKLAVNKFHKALNLIDRAVKNIEEEREQQNLAVKLYVNIAICHNLMNQPEMACVNCKDALKIEPNNPKAIFNFGRAKLQLSNFKDAKYYLLRAQQLEPNNEMVNEYLIKLEEKKTLFHEAEKETAIKMMKNLGGVTLEEQELAKMSESDRKFVIKFCKDMEKFVNTPGTNRIDFPPCVGAKEEEIMKEETQKLGLYYNKVKSGEGMRIIISKPEKQPKK